MVFRHERLTFLSKIGDPVPEYKVKHAFRIALRKVAPSIKHIPVKVAIEKQIELYHWLASQKVGEGKKRRR